MDFRAQGLTGIQVRPGAWFDVNFIRQNKRCMAPYIAPHKALSLIPKVAWVAYKPHIKLTLSKTEWTKVQTYWKNPKTIGMTIGGSLFRHRNYRKFIKSDKDVWGALSEEQQAFYNDESLEDQHNDDVSFHVETREKTLNDEDEVTFAVEEAAAEDEEELRDSASFNQRTVTRVIHDDEELVHQNTQSESLWFRRGKRGYADNEIKNQLSLQTDSQWLFRRRRRRRRRPPPPPKKIYEKVYTVHFKSNSPFPEIIGVTSQKVQHI
eukprot:CAMPEP_0117428334 /NCGR_PEP_ID=MMETSP0758-20121206/8076_1 /TAXON_ID=63605 /ORGANISM="Percolomonas cosmopolitus, Strain AE-1 (ATCC 50343)" /LENGTH=264 /DNA_ID=CAMNT_0005214655 /DNA_START=740 /DNA_END=1534 /DNA_ORIENTATION=+